MTERAFIVLSLLCVAAAGCSNENVIPLTDPGTGEPIGFYDVDANQYVFDDGRVVDRSTLQPPPDDGSDLAVGYNALKAPPDWDCERRPGQEVCAGPDGSSCWEMYECRPGQCVSCTGCCYNRGGGRWYCWEICTDVTSTDEEEELRTLSPFGR